MTMTSDARRGYSSALVQLINQSDPESVVTRFAKYCIEKNISVIEIAQAFNVTRATVYFWFKGAFKPREKHIAGMLEVLRAAGRA